MTAIKKAALALIAIAITAGYHWHTHRVITPKAATWNDVLAEVRQGGYAIIDTDALWDRYRKDPDSVLLVDTRRNGSTAPDTSKASLIFRSSRPGCRAGEIIAPLRNFWEQ